MMATKLVLETLITILTVVKQALTLTTAKTLIRTIIKIQINELTENEEQSPTL